MIDWVYLGALMLIPFSLLVATILSLLWLRKATSHKREFASKYYINALTGVFSGLMVAIALELKGDGLTVGRFIASLLLILIVFVAGYYIVNFVDESK